LLVIQTYDEVDYHVYPGKKILEHYQHKYETSMEKLTIYSTDEEWDLYEKADQLYLNELQLFIKWYEMQKFKRTKNNIVL